MNFRKSSWLRLAALARSLSQVALRYQWPHKLQVTFNQVTKDLMKTYVKYPPRKIQSESYSGPVTLQQYERFKFMRDQLAQNGFTLSIPTGN